MTKLALYEKNHIKKDQARVNYFIEDYIYINNFKTRLGITIITLFFVGIGALNILNDGVIFPKSLWELIDVYFKPYFLPWITALIIYTSISTAIYGREYQVAKQRFKNYRKLLKQLDTYEQEQKSDEGEEHEI